MDNFERWYRLHVQKGDMPDSMAKYYNHKYGVKRHAGVKYDLTTFAGIQRCVRDGKIAQYFTPHVTQITTYRNGSPIVWDVVAIDHDTPSDPQYKHSLTLQTHDCVAELQYDAAEALYSQDTVLPAGTYYFCVTSHTWHSADVGKNFCFTLSNDVPAGGQIVITMRYNDTFDGRSINIYSSGQSAEVIETTTLAAGDSGVFLGNVGNAVNGNFNSVHRLSLGSNNYNESALRQWINSDKKTGQVWSPQSKWDRPPAWATNTAGFLNGLDPDFINVVGSTHIVTARSVNYEGGANKDESDDKFFLISRREGYAGNELSAVIEGEPYPYYSDYSDLSAPGTGNDVNRIKYRNGAAKWWWTRTPHTGNGNSIRRFNTSGSLNSINANDVNSVALACNIY